MRKRRLLAAVLLPLFVTATAGLGACTGATVVNAGEMMPLEFDFADFTRLDISHGFVVDVQPADEFRVSVRVDRAVFEYLIVEKRGDTLHVGLENGNTYVNTTQEATITLPVLKGLTLSGASQATLGRFPGATALTLNLSGASRADIATDALDTAEFGLAGASRVTGALTAATFKLKLSGASFARLEGTAPALEITGAGASNADLTALPAASVKLDLSGGSTASINVADRIDAALSGGSVVNYLGDPKMGNLDISGGSTIRKAQ